MPMAEPDPQDLGQNETLTAVAEVVPEVPAPPSPPKRRGMSVLLGLVAGGALAAGAGFGLARYVVPEGWPLASTNALEAKLAEQSTQLEALKAELTQAATALATLPAEDRVAKLEQALAKVQSAPAAAVDEGRLTDLESRLAELEARPVGQNAAILAPSAADETAAKARLAEVEAQAAKVQADAEALAKSTMLKAALGKVQTAVDSGQPFAAALAELQTTGQTVPEALQAAAAEGVPSLKSLQQSFPDAARLALDAALRANMGETTTDRLTSFLRTQTGVRSLTPQEGTDPDAVLSRAEAALAADDLATTFTELAALPPEAQAAMTDWVAQAQSRVQALDSLATLAAALE